MKRQIVFSTVICFFLVTTSLPSPVVAQSNNDAMSRLVGEVFINGQQMRYLTMLSDGIGHRLTSSEHCRRAEALTAAEMKRIGLENVHLEKYAIPVSWERGTAQASLNNIRPLTVASYTWTPSTNGAIEGNVVDVGGGTAEDVARVRAKLKGTIALARPAGTTLDETIGNFYRTPLLVNELKDAGAIAVLIASDKSNATLYTAPVDFNARLAALPTVSLAREDVSLMQRLLTENKPARVRLDVKNKIAGAFEAANVVGEIRGREKPDEIIVIGAHLDSNDLGPGALDNAAGVAATLETARAIKTLKLQPRRTVRFVLFTGEEEGMLGSTAYAKQHRNEMPNIVAALVMDIGAGRPLGWFSMGREDLDTAIRELSKPIANISGNTIVHSAFAATDNAAFMAEGVPNLILLQDDAPYFPVHHTIADTPDKADARDFASCVATLAATAFQIADAPGRFGRRLNSDEVKKLATETKVDAQWRAAGIWQ
ncbi:MAG: M28 family metallopeptidase [Pyrinomonadaceae bacterium]